MKKISIGIKLLILLLIILSCVSIYKIIIKNDDTKKVSVIESDPKNGTYLINGEKVTLRNGVSEVEAATGSASKIITRYFGNGVRYDLDGDNTLDDAFIISQETGGSGTFYYFVAQLNTSSGPLGSEAIFIGDRIAPQSTNMGKGKIIVVNYAERKPDESFVVAPSIGKSLWLLLDPKTMQFGEVVQNFEGEADPTKMNLRMKKWNWINTIYNNDTEIKPKVENKFTITFTNKNTFSASTDCNGVGGEYSVNGNKIVFNKMMSTLMYCENSQESDFTKMLSEADSYHFTTKGELVLDLKFDSGSVIFR